MLYVLRSIGPLAHLAERLHGMQEVTGSIPVRSTTIFTDQMCSKSPDHLGALEH